MSNQKRVDLYKLIHKAQRAHLFALSSRIGRADFSDEEEARSIEQELRGMISHLKGHSLNETTYIHPLFNEIGNQIAAIEHEHDDLEKELFKLECILNEKEWEQLYPEFNRFIASYLTHQDEEERMQADILWKYFDDSRLAAAFAAFQASRSPAQRREDLSFIVPGLSIPELAGIVHHIKASAPIPAFEEACQLIQKHLEPSRWAELCKSLSINKEAKDES